MNIAVCRGLAQAQSCSACTASSLLCRPMPILAVFGAHKGGVFVVGSLVWGMVVGGFRPDRVDVIGAGVRLVGVAVIMYATRGA